MDVLQGLKEDGLRLKKIKKKDQTAEQCSVAIAENPKALRLAATKCLDHKTCLDAVKREPRVFRYVPVKLIDKEMCRIAVSADLRLFDKVPDKWRTSDVCLLAMEKDISIFQKLNPYIKRDLIRNVSIDRMRELINNDINSMQYLPVNADTVMLCLEYLK